MRPGDDFWYVLPDYPYRVGRDGAVSRFFRGRGGKNPRWKPVKVDKLGRVTLCLHNEPKEVSVARLVLDAFGPPQPPGHEPLHFPDADLRNNAIENLRWVPDGTNLVGHPALIEHGQKLPKRRALTDSEVVESVRLAAAGETAATIAIRFGVAKKTIERILYGKTYRNVERPQLPPRRYRRGEAHYGAVLSPDKIARAAQLRAEGLTLEEIAASLGCGTSTLSRALNGVSWKHLRREAGTGQEG
jgi:hypothetical protein